MFVFHQVIFLSNQFFRNIGTAALFCQLHLRLLCFAVSWNNLSRHFTHELSLTRLISVHQPYTTCLFYHNYLFLQIEPPPNQRWGPVYHHQLHWSRKSPSAQRTKNYSICFSTKLLISVPSTISLVEHDVTLDDHKLLPCVIRIIQAPPRLVIDRFLVAAV